MSRYSSDDDWVATLVMWIVLLPIMLIIFAVKLYQDRKEREAAEEAARIYRLPDEYIHV